jgi:pimeloyl-ACP methyl ester carboxylesterase
MTEAEFQYQGSPIFYRSIGDGPAVVLLHGFGEEGSIWKNQYENLDGVRLLVPDLPGSGKSPSVNDMTMEGLADAVHALVRGVLPGEQIILVGHSMGGYIALAYAEKYAETLAGLGLFHSSAFADSDEKKDTRRKGIAFINENGAQAFLKTTIPNLYAPATREKYPSWINGHISSTHNFSGAALVSYYESMMKRPDRTAVLKNARVPVLLVLGKFDSAVPLEDGLKQTHMADLSYIHILGEAGHMGMIEAKEEANRILQDFINQTLARTTPE